MKFAKKLLAGVLAAAIMFSCFITLSFATDGGDGGDQEPPVKTVSELFVEEVAAIDTENTDYAYLTATYASLTAKKDAADFDPTFAGVEAALVIYNQLGAAIEEYKEFSDTFIAMSGRYDPNNKDYTYMLTCLANFEYLLNKANPTYTGMADAVAIYNALEAKIDAIDANAVKFMTAVSQMTITQAGSVSATAPYLTTNFADLLAKYNIAMSVFANGTVHPGLDAATYPGLSEKIAIFTANNGFKAYVESRILDCETFVSAVNKAASSSSYVSILAELDKAALYIDANKEKSLENYAGVAEAVVLYGTLRAALVQSVTDANAYIAAVNAIDINASYAALKAAVNTARALKEKGDVAGITGVAEANIKYSAAESKVVSLEGNSKTLKDAVAALKEATDIAERRELIFIAKNAKAKAEDSISGVTDAKTELEAQIAKFNSDVAAANAEMFALMNGVAVVTAASAPVGGAYRAIDIIKALLK